MKSINNYIYMMASRAKITFILHPSSYILHPPLKILMRDLPPRLAQRKYQ